MPRAAAPAAGNFSCAYACMHVLGSPCTHVVCMQVLGFPCVHVASMHAGEKHACMPILTKTRRCDPQRRASKVKQKALTPRRRKSECWRGFLGGRRRSRTHLHTSVATRSNQCMFSAVHAPVPDEEVLSAVPVCVYQSPISFYIYILAEGRGFVNPFSAFF